MRGQCIPDWADSWCVSLVCLQKSHGEELVCLAHLHNIISSELVSTRAMVLAICGTFWPI